MNTDVHVHVHLFMNIDIHEHDRYDPKRLYTAVTRSLHSRYTIVTRPWRAFAREHSMFMFMFIYSCSCSRNVHEYFNEY